MHLAILLVAAVAASNQYGPGYGGQPSQPSQPSQYPPSYPYPPPAPLPYPLPYGDEDEGQGAPRCRSCRRVRTFKNDATRVYGTVLIKEKRTLGKCTVSIVTCKGEEGQTFTLIDEKKRTLATGSHIRHRIICMGGKRWKTKDADDEKVVFTKLACVVNPDATTVGPSTTVELTTITSAQPITTTTAEPSTTSPLPADCASCTNSVQVFNPSQYQGTKKLYSPSEEMTFTAEGCLKRTFTCAVPSGANMVLLYFRIGPVDGNDRTSHVRSEVPAKGPVSGDLVCDSTGRWADPRAEEPGQATTASRYPQQVVCESPF